MKLLNVKSSGIHGNRAGTATRYGLEGSGIDSQWEARYSAPVQIGTGALPASYKWILGLNGG
jgi:hypothetical protein